MCDLDLEHFRKNVICGVKMATASQLNFAHVHTDQIPFFFFFFFGGGGRGG